MVIIQIVDFRTNNMLRVISKQIAIPSINDLIIFHDTNKQYIVIERRFTYSYIRAELLTVSIVVKSKN